MILCHGDVCVCRVEHKKATDFNSAVMYLVYWFIHSFTNLFILHIFVQPLPWSHANDEEQLFPCRIPQLSEVRKTNAIISFSEILRANNEDEHRNEDEEGQVTR